MISPKQLAKLQSVLTEAHTDFGRALNKRAFFKVSDHEIGDDLVQDTFLKTWKYLVKGGEIVLMRAFLYRVLDNLIVDYYRKFKTTSLDALLEKNFDPGLDLTEDILNFIDGEMAMLLIPDLPEIYKKVIYMRYVELLSLKEMSSLTGESANNLSVKTFRGLQKLKVLYDHREAL